MLENAQKIKLKIPPPTSKSLLKIKALSCFLPIPPPQSTPLHHHNATPTTSPHSRHISSPPCLHHNCKCTQHHTHTSQTPSILHLQPLPHSHPPRRRNQSPPDHYCPRSRQCCHVIFNIQAALCLHSKECSLFTRSC